MVEGVNEHNEGFSSTGCFFHSKEHLSKVLKRFSRHKKVSRNINAQITQTRLKPFSKNLIPLKPVRQKKWNAASKLTPRLLNTNPTQFEVF